MPTLCRAGDGVVADRGGAVVGNRDDEPPDIPDAAITGVRRDAGRDDRLLPRPRGEAAVLRQEPGHRGATRTCCAAVPRGRFICLYRHPMDVIASGIEACPWGLNGYGFDAVYRRDTRQRGARPRPVLGRTTPGDPGGRGALRRPLPPGAVRGPGRRPEDALPRASSPSSACPGARDLGGCFSGERERFGPADHKIWRDLTDHQRFRRPRLVAPPR